MLRIFCCFFIFATASLAHDLPSLDGFFPGRLGNLLAGTYYWHDVSPVPKLSPKAEALLRQSLKGIPYIVDAHMHLVGTQTNLTGCHAHQENSWKSVQWVKQKTLSAAAGVSKVEEADSSIAGRLLALVSHFPYDVPYYGALFAFSPTYDLISGKIDMGKTSLSVPNDYMLKICNSAPSRLIPVGSVHPYDSDALDKLRALKSQGVHIIKWLPNSQHIAPGHPKSVKFLSEMAKLKMVLIAHVGDEHAVSATGVNNDYGNPELFRRALETEPDLRVIFAHVGSEGISVINGKKRENFDIVIELLKKYPKQAFADISAFSSAIRRVGYLPRLLKEKSIHGQLIYGTDYPLPAISGLVYWSTKKMWTKSLLTLGQTSLIHQLFRHNPLAAAFVTMRQISYEGSSLPPEVFYKNFSKVFHKGHVPRQLPPS